MTKSVNDPTPNVGDTVTYIVTISNAGPDTATSVQVSDELPSGISFVSAMPSQGTYDPSTGIWSVGTVTTSAPQTLVVEGTVTSPDPQTNTTRITHSDQYNPNPAGNIATATVTPQQADLALSKTVNDPTPVVGETITYTILVSNSGPDAATSVQVTDDLPAGLYVRVGYAEPGDIRSRGRTLERGDGRRWLSGHAVDPGDGRQRRPADQRGGDHPCRPVRPIAQRHHRRSRGAPDARPHPDPDPDRAPDRDPDPDPDSHVLCHLTAAVRVPCTAD